MPQLNLADYAPQLVWLAITFISLYLLMARLALPRIAEVLEARQNRIAGDLDAAGALKSEAEEVLGLYQTELEEARSKAHEIAMEGHQRIVAEGERRQDELVAGLAEKAKQAEARISQAKEAALTQVLEVAVEAAGDVVERLIDERVSDQIVRAAVEAEMAQRRNAGG